TIGSAPLVKECAFFVRGLLTSTTQFSDFLSNLSQLPARTIAREIDFYDERAIRSPRLLKRVVKLAFCRNGNAFTATDEFADLLVVPLSNGVETTLSNPPHRPIAIIIQNHNDWIKTKTNGSRKFYSGHLKGSVAYQHEGSQLFRCHCDANAGRHGKTHRHIV